jgi:hypothetical protein
MTPLLIPGAEGDVPIMTWGQVDSTPLRVPEPFDAAEEAAAARSNGGSGSNSSAGFHIKGPSYREKVASALEAQTRRKAGGTKARRQQRQQQQQQQQQQQGATPSSGVGTGKRDVRSLTPAAQSLAAKLAGSLGGAAGQQPRGGLGAFGVGGSQQLRASYGGGPPSALGAGARPSSGRAAVAASASAASAARAAAGVPTPSPSPMRVVPTKRAPVAAGGGGGGEGGIKKAGGGGKSAVTENLLNI